jgi:adenosylcobinamide kinase / adenosylcobinamide-phosphate guanylyltransferase
VSREGLILITGGGRSGKSSYAQRLVEALPGPRIYLATSIPFDAELQERVAKHRESRQQGAWAATVEEPLALAEAIRGAPGSATILVDCLTMWVGNLMWAAEQEAGATECGATVGGAIPVLTEAQVASLCSEVVAASREREGSVVFVTNEVGLGIIPENPAARLYRDLLGRCNQVMAAAADTVLLMVSGLPLVLKGQGPLAPGDPAGGPSPAPAAGPAAGASGSAPDGYGSPPVPA